VGYTNAGKSTLLNALCKTDILTDDRLFATLDPTTRRLHLPNNSKVLLSDTVGFIRKLPPTIIHAFRATLEELTEANLLLHIVDVSSPDAPEQCRAVEKILGELGLLDKKRVTVLNKIDLLFPDEPLPSGEGIESIFASLGIAPDENTVIISAVKGWGLPRLLGVITQGISSSVTFPSD
jgi:GTP-binding protein HflX